MLQFHASENKVHQLRVAIEHEGYEIDDQDGNGWTALHYAAFGGKQTLSALALLIDLGAELDVKNRNGDTPLHTCGREEHVETLRTLIRVGADIYCKNNQNLTPLQVFKGSDRELRLDIAEGMHARNERARKKAEAEERRAMERKMAQGLVVKNVKEISAESKRQRYMELRDKLVTRMKVSKASHVKGMTNMAMQLDQIRAEEKTRAQLLKQREEGWKGLATAEMALSEPAAVAELESAEERGAEEEEVEAKKELIALEIESLALTEIYSVADGEIGGVRSRVDASEARVEGLERMLPLAGLIKTALRVQQERERIGWVPKWRNELQPETAPPTPPPPTPPPAVGPLQTCGRCGKEYNDDPTNNPVSACRFHPGERIVTENWAAGWSCCRRSTEGCRTSSHTTILQLQVAETRMKMPPAPPPHPPPMRFPGAF